MSTRDVLAGDVSGSAVANARQAPLWKGPVKIKSAANRHLWDDRYLVLTATTLSVFISAAHYDENKSTGSIVIPTTLLQKGSSPDKGKGGECRVSISMSDRKQTLECITETAADAQNLLACCLGVSQVSHASTGPKTARDQQKSAFALVKDAKKFSIPDKVNTIEYLKSKKLYEKCSIKIAAAADEVIHYHFHNQMRLVFGDELGNAIVLTDLRILQLEDGKLKTEVPLDRIRKANMKTLSTTQYDIIFFELDDQTAKQMDFARSDAAKFFQDFILKYLENKDRMGTDFVKPVEVSTEIPSIVNSGDGLKYIMESIAKHKRMSFQLGEKIRFHAYNSKNKVRLTTHAHLSTSNCVILTNRRLVTIEASKLNADIDLNTICRVKLTRTNQLKYDVLEIHFFNGAATKVAIADDQVSVFLAQAINQFLQERFFRKPEGEAKEKVTKSHTHKEDFDDHACFYIIPEYKKHGDDSGTTLCLDHRPLQDDPTHFELVLAPYTGSVTQKWVKIPGDEKNNNFTSVVPFLLTTGQPEAELNVTAWVRKEKWILDETNGGIRQRDCDYLYLTLNGLCCGNIHCEKDNIRAGALAFLKPCLGEVEDGKMAGQKLVSELAKWQFRTSFELFMYDLVEPLVAQLQYYQTQGEEALEEFKDGFPVLDKVSGEDNFLPVYGTEDWNSPFSVWEPKTIGSQVIFGHYCRAGSARPTHVVTVARANPYLVHPASFELIHTYHPPGKGVCYFWQPIPANIKDFVALGVLCTKTNAAPPLNKCVCADRQILKELDGVENVHGFTILPAPDSEQASFLEIEDLRMDLTVIAEGAGAGILQGVGLLFTPVTCVAKVGAGVLRTVTQKTTGVDLAKLFESDEAEPKKIYEDHSLWRLDGLNTFFINKGHSLDGLIPFFRLKAHTRDVSVRTKLANLGVHFSGEATSHMLTLITNRLKEADADDYEFDEDTISYSFEQLFDLLNASKEFFDFEEKEKTIPEKDILEIQFEMAQKRCEECERLIKRFIYLHIDVAHLTSHERVVRLNCVWPVVMMLRATWEERVSWDFPLDPAMMNEDLEASKQARIEGESAVEFKKGWAEMSVLLLKHLTKQIRRQLVEIFPLITSLQNEDEAIHDYSEEEEEEPEEQEEEEGYEVGGDVPPTPRMPPPPTPLARGPTSRSLRASRQKRKTSEEEEEEKAPDPWWKSSAFFLGGWIAALLKSKNIEEEPEEVVLRTPRVHADPARHVHQVTQQREGFAKRSASMRSLPDLSSRRSSVGAVPVDQQISAEVVLAAVSTACDLLKTLTTASTCGPVDPFLREAILLLFHPPIFDYLRCRVNAESITSQQAVDVVRLISKYERLVGKCVTARSKDMLSQDLFDIVDVYMDAYDRFTKDKLFNWVKNILAREITSATYHLKDGLSHTHGPLDLFSNINNALDIAVEEHYLGGKALVRLFTTYAHVVNYFQSSQLRTLGSAKVSATLGDIHDSEMKEEIPLSATQSVSLTWLQAQANNAALYQEATKDLLEKCLKLLSDVDVEERALTSETLQRVSEGFYNVGIRVVDVLAEVAAKYVQHTLQVCFTDAWFENHDTAMQEVHGDGGDLDAIVARFIRGLSDAHAAHLVLILVRRLVSHYFNFFVKHLAGKKLNVINDDEKLWDRIKDDQGDFAEFFQQFHELVDEKQFEHELEWMDRLQEIAECDIDLVSVLKSRLDERFRTDPVIGTDRVLEGVLVLREDLRKNQVAAAVALKVETVAEGDTAAGLEINVERGEDLAIKDAYSSDPFVKIILIGAGDRRLSERSTHVIKSNLNPVWHYSCSNYPSDILARAQKVLFECWDWDLLGGGDFMGRAFVDMNEIKQNADDHSGPEGYTITLDLQPCVDYDEEVQGTITVNFRYWTKNGGAAESEDFEKSMSTFLQARKENQNRLGAMAKKQGVEGPKRTSVLNRIAQAK